MTLHFFHFSSLRKPSGLFTISFLESLGDSFSRSLLPIVAVSFLNTGTQIVGIINSFGLIAFLLLSLPLGILADRTGAPHKLMLFGTISRAVLTLSVVFTFSLGLLKDGIGIAILMMLALLIGIADVAFSSGQSLLIPQLVAQSEVRSIYGKVQAISQTGGALGPLMLSVTLAMLVAPIAWIVSAIFYIFSAFSQRTIPVPKAPPTEIRAKQSPFQQVKDGVRELFSHSSLAIVTTSNALTNASVMAANTLVPIIALTILNLSPAQFAFTAIFGSISGILGASYASALTDKFGLAQTRIFSGLALFVGIATLCIVVQVQIHQYSLIAICFQYALNGACTAMLMVSGSDLAPQMITVERLGTVMGAARTLVIGVMPLSALTFGMLGAVFGIIPAMWLWLALTLLAVFPNFFLPRSLKNRSF